MPCCCIDLIVVVEGGPASPLTSLPGHQSLSYQCLAFLVRLPSSDRLNLVQLPQFDLFLDWWNLNLALPCNSCLQGIEYATPVSYLCNNDTHTIETIISRVSMEFWNRPKTCFHRHSQLHVIVTILIHLIFNCLSTRLYEERRWERERRREWVCVGYPLRRNSPFVYCTAGLLCLYDW